ncbi:M23 family metallopeptidase, partial [Ruminococcaceae bacterium OttesenSCG-928-D13]|nr:M23 family metallopeptidase [Ruminococcaceae bacterium OttesenSCG-928-D13]
QQAKKARKEYVVKKAEMARRTEQAGRIRDVERGGSSASTTGNTTPGTGGKVSPKGRAKAKAVKNNRGAMLSKMSRPGARTSKAALAGRKAGRAGAGQLKQQAAKVAQAAAKRTAQAARHMAQMLANAAKAVVKVLSMIVSAAGPFVVILIAFAAIAMMIASPFGLFFSKEDTGQGVAPISTVIREVAEDFNSRIKEIQDTNEWDELQVHYSGKRGNNWKDVLAVFAVKTVLYDENAADVVTIDADRAERIRGVFWDMTELAHNIEEVPHYDAATDTTTYTYILHITITQRAANTQANSYAFTQDQRDILAEMLSEAYDELFRDLIGGAGEIGDGTPVVGIGSYIWPSDASNRVTSYFGSRTHPVTGDPDDHYGIDIGAGHGTNVLAADGGRVVTSEWHWSYGNHIIIDHGDGRRTLYAHMSVLVASSGQNVAQGEVIGLVGSTGVVKGAHLHFETHVNGVRVDPLSYFSGYG